ncbi:hypothetical protein [Gloeobacter kilaueensis]|uniref:Uncharacterized protein n=1 Tax=Gloeobacter kilaueensis (strain ATCC BAA-2537 / CCAP 1431/1 / ULC 316 / JS1) TaxID=1183438 RepID=U5QE59_GLOK1|nr:hypothetical protein [Gloeobacter kilaueensis]AGY57163.1 hypothetical protein GKIL_0917 [Gloeobacter kilaueensis JS1]
MSRLGVADLTAAWWRTAKVPQQRQNEVIRLIRRILAHKAEYLAVEEAAGVPWWFVAALHYRESNLDFDTYLGNGDPLDKPTRNVPAGRGPFATWHEGAIDALRLQGYVGLSWLDMATALRRAERFNGVAYRKMGLPSPYVWAATTIQRPGKYVRDHVFDPKAVDFQLGVAAIWKYLAPPIPVIAPNKAKGKAA